MSKKIQFDIKYRPQIESGEYKVETRDGRKARIIHWDLNCTSPIVAVMDAHIDLPGEIVDVFSVSGMAFDDIESPSDLFLVTPEEKLTEFEKAFDNLAELYHSDENPDDVACCKEYAAKLLSLAREQFIKDGYVIEKKAFHDAVENVSDKHLAEMSVEYSIHCKVEDGTRHAVMNWDTFQKVAQKFIEIGKADALKDLPRWSRVSSECSTLTYTTRNDLFLFHKGYGILLSELEKLHGFKED